MIPGQPRSALLFIPDISGFTQFVTDTEISHSQHIVQELLEILIDSNHLNLQICEIEGDAIFFYKDGNKPDLESLLQQVEKMFTRFHGHLKLYEHQRICPCGACKRAVDLSLKIVVHFGEVTGISVKDHKKLFGKDVILIHRLLKNNLAKKEYVLLTDPVFSEIESKNLPSWYLPQQGTEQYDVGDVQFYFSDLSSLHNNVQINYPVYNSSDRTYIAFSREEILPASLEKTFESLLDMQQQLKQPAEKKTDANAPEDIARIGTRHPCLITRNNSINVIESVKMETERIELVEMNEKGVAGYRYILKKLSPEQTTISVQMLVKNNPIFRVIFFLAIKAKMVGRIGSFFSNMKDYLKKQVSPGLSI